MIKQAISKLIQQQSLTYEEAQSVMEQIMSGKATPAQVAAYLTALHTKGESSDEIAASAYVMRKFASQVKREGDAMDIVGTGGDQSNTFNISTIASIVVSSAGVQVAKHGNRAASSKCGTADCLEELGVKLAIDPNRNAQILKQTHLCFMFAQSYHAAMKYVGPVRREIGIPTIFNILGPLTNPAHTNLQLIGVYNENLLERVAKSLHKLGTKRAMVVYGQDCLDEISLSAATTVLELNEGNIKMYEICPEDFGMKRCKKEELVGGDAACNAGIVRAILKGEKGPKRDAVVLNAAAALHVAKNITLKEGIDMAESLIDSGKALAQLDTFIAATNEE